MNYKVPYKHQVLQLTNIPSFKADLSPEPLNPSKVCAHSHLMLRAMLHSQTIPVLDNTMCHNSRF